MRKATVTGLLLGVFLALSVNSCGGDMFADDCNYLRTCGGGAGGATAGSSGTAGDAGGSSAGGGSGSGNVGGTASGGMGASGETNSGGAAGAEPCQGLCVGKTPVCNEVTNTCVECIGDSHCTGALPACDTSTNTCVACTGSKYCPSATPACDTKTQECVECTGNTDCSDGAKPFCDVSAQKCVGCLKQADCTDATSSACVAGSCTACTKDAECSNITGKGVCNAGTCVQCTGKNSSACGQSLGTPLVCDSLQHTCTTNKQASAGLCQSCVSDAQCTAGKMCVQEQFGSPAKPVGYFCFWKKGDTADGAPTTCLPGADPYAATLTNVISIDGTKSDICSLRSSTCVASNQFSSKDCKNVAVPDDSLCGFASTKDSKCAQADVGVFRCTMTCGSDDDCPSPFTCNTGATPRVCNLQ